MLENHTSLTLEENLIVSAGDLNHASDIILRLGAAVCEQQIAQENDKGETWILGLDARNRLAETLENTLFPVDLSENRSIKLLCKLLATTSPAYLDFILSAYATNEKTEKPEGN